jgi:hypothetical protein
VLAAYIMLGLRSWRPYSVRIPSARRTMLRLTAGGALSAELWLVVNLLRDENFLCELWAARPPQHENAVRALLLFLCGWAGWTVTFSEVFRR